MPHKKTKKLFEEVAIIGVGLIGGSIGWEIKMRRLASKVVGFGRTRKNLNIAISRELIDHAAVDLKEAVKNADLILVCTPVKIIEDQLKEIVRYAKNQALVMDAGSTKMDIVKIADRIFPEHLSFVGAHPIAGTENSGAKSAEAFLFEGARCLLTPSVSSKSGSIGQARVFWEALGMKVDVIQPEEHDKILALTSHLPHMVAFTLMQLLSKELNVNEIKKCAGGGLLDTTRIAASPSEMWRDIVLSNKNNLVRLLKKYKIEIESLIKFLETESGLKLEKYFQTSSSIRHQLKK